MATSNLSCSRRAATRPPFAKESARNLQPADHTTRQRVKAVHIFKLAGTTSSPRGCGPSSKGACVIVRPCKHLCKGG